MADELTMNGRAPRCMTWVCANESLISSCGKKTRNSTKVEDWGRTSCCRRVMRSVLELELGRAEWEVAENLIFR